MHMTTLVLKNAVLGGDRKIERPAKNCYPAIKMLKFSCRFIDI